MLTEAAVTHFKGRAGIVRALGDGRSKAAVYHWGRVVPRAAAKILAEKSDGALTVDESLYNEFGHIKPEARAA
jgi:hypothetical protein